MGTLKCEVRFNAKEGPDLVVPKGARVEVVDPKTLEGHAAKLWKWRERQRKARVKASGQKEPRYRVALIGGEPRFIDPRDIRMDPKPYRRDLAGYG